MLVKADIMKELPNITDATLDYAEMVQGVDAEYTL